MPTVLRRYGFRFHFYGADMDEPAHIHVTGQGAAAKVWLDPIRIADQKGFKSSDLKRILEVANEHRKEFAEAWNEFARLVQRG